MKIKQRIIAMVLCFTVATATITFRPQKADAVALTSTAAIVALVASVMTACGVSYWASTQQDAVSYLGGKLETYLGTLTESYSSLLDWLGINSISDAFAILNGGILRVPTAIANKILDFVNWFNQEENIESNGSSVGNGNLTNLEQYIEGNFSGSVYYENVGDRIRLVFSDYRNNDTGRKMFNVLVPLTTTGGVTVTVVTCTINSGYGGWGISKYDGSNLSTYWGSGRSYGVGANNSMTVSVPYIIVGAHISGSAGSNTLNGYVEYTVKNSDLGTASTAVVTPSDSVVVPPALEDGQSLVVTTTAPITDGDTNEEACQAILDTVVSVDGLSAENQVQIGATSGWRWLSDILERIEGLLQGVQENTAEAQYESGEDYELDLTTVFPFCIPWDIDRALRLLVAEPVTPSIEWDFPLPDGSTYTLELDLSDYDDLAELLRHFELLLFAIGLAVATKKLIKW